MLKGRISPVDAVFERNLVALILRENGFFGLIQHLITPDYFSERYQTPIKKFISHYNKYGKQLFRTELEHACKQDLKRLYSVKLENLAHDYYIQAFIDFARSFKFEQAVMRSAEYVDQKTSGKETDFDELQPMFKEIFEIAVIRNHGLDYFKDLKANIREAKDYGSDRIKTGWPLVDKYLDGGLGIELGMVMGATHVGKSICAYNLGAFAVMCGRHVLVVTNEMSDKQVNMKFNMRFAKMTKQAIRINPSRAYKIIKALKTTNGGKLIIQDHRASRPSIQQFEGMLKSYSMTHGMPDMLILDLLDKFKPANHKAPGHEQLQQIYEDTRKMGAALGTRVWAISQTNREGYDGEVSELHHAKGSLSKPQEVDTALILCQTKDERLKKVLRIHVAKNREGESGQIVKFRTDYARTYLEESGQQDG